MQGLLTDSISSGFVRPFELADLRAVCVVVGEGDVYHANARLIDGRGAIAVFWVPNDGHTSLLAGSVHKLIAGSTGYPEDRDEAEKRLQQLEAPAE